MSRGWNWQNGIICEIGDEETAVKAGRGRSGGQPTDNAMNNSGEHNFSIYLGVSLWISSMELPPDRITQIVGIEPSYVRARGALISGRRIGRRPEFDVHEWQFREQLNVKPGDNIDDHSEKFITEFLDKIKDAAPMWS
jgi:hypothetical protein